MKEIEFIIYVSSQEKSKNFYEQLLQIKPCLNVPGMTEFELDSHVKLGLMPENGVAKILSDKMPHPKDGHGIPRCELYFKVVNAEKYVERGIKIGGKLISNLKLRDWGDKVAYISDLDGHIIAFVDDNLNGKNN